MEVIKKCFQKNLKDSNDSWHFLTTSQWMNSKDAIFFIWIRLIFGQNPCFSGPRQLGRWKVNRSLLTDSSLLSSDQNCPQFFIVTQFSQSQLKSWVHSSRVNTASSVSLLVPPHSSRYVLNNKKLVGTYANFIRKSLQPLTTKARQWLLSDISQMFCPI